MVVQGTGDELQIKNCDVCVCDKSNIQEVRMRICQSRYPLLQILSNQGCLGSLSKYYPTWICASQQSWPVPLAYQVIPQLDIIEYHIPLVPTHMEATIFSRGTQGSLGPPYIIRQDPRRLLQQRFKGRQILDRMMAVPCASWFDSIAIYLCGFPKWCSCGPSANLWLLCQKVSMDVAMIVLQMLT